MSYFLHVSISSCVNFFIFLNFYVSISSRVNFFMCQFLHVNIYLFFIIINSFLGGVWWHLGVGCNSVWTLMIPYWGYLWVYRMKCGPLEEGVHIFLYIFLYIIFFHPKLRGLWLSLYNWGTYLIWIITEVWSWCYWKGPLVSDLKGFHKGSVIWGSVMN